MNEKSLQYLTIGQPSRIIVGLIELVEREFVVNDWIKRFYIGRCGLRRLASRQEDHQASCVYPIYLTNSPDFSRAIEEALIREFHPCGKCNSRSYLEGDNSTFDENYCVYIAVW
jgi:hypothetical protein